MRRTYKRSEVLRVRELDMSTVQQSDGDMAALLFFDHHFDNRHAVRLTPPEVVELADQLESFMFANPDLFT